MMMMVMVMIIMRIVMMTETATNRFEFARHCTKHFTFIILLFTVL